MVQYNFITPVKAFVDKLVVADYREIINLSADKERLEANHIAEAVRLYPGRITTPPATAYNELAVYEYDDGTGYMLEFFLWLDNEPSDLMIRIEACRNDDGLRYTFWDILVP